MTNDNFTDPKTPGVARAQTTPKGFSAEAGAQDVTYLTFIEHPEQDRREGERRSGHDRRQPTT